MMAGKAEINELTKTMDNTAKIVKELKSELILVWNVAKWGDDEIMLKKTKSELRDTEAKFWSFPVIDNGYECDSNAPTEDSNPLVFKMDKLGAELEFELQKHLVHTNDTNFHEEMRPKLEEFGCDQETPFQLKVPNEGYDGTCDLNFNSSQYHGVVLPSELNQKLSRLLIEQQENQIVELESELNLAQSKLQKKESELQALKNCVTLLSELPISTVSDGYSLPRH